VGALASLPEELDLILYLDLGASTGSLGLLFVDHFEGNFFEFEQLMNSTGVGTSRNSI